MEAREARQKEWVCAGACEKAGGSARRAGRCQKGLNFINFFYFKDYLFHDFESNLEVIYL